MLNFISRFISYYIGDWKNVFIGALIVMGVVIFLMGILKNALFNRIKNKLLRKVLLSFCSLALVLPATFAYSIYQGLDMQYFWALYALNAIGTIVVYWFYENTGFRNLLSLIGRNTLVRLFQSGDIKNTIEKSKEELISASKYNEDDLDNL